MRARSKKHTEDYLFRGPPGYYRYEQEWWKPHVVYVIHYESQHLYKVGITKVGTARIRELCGGGRGIPIQAEEFANRHAAMLVECEILALTDRWRAMGDPLQGGAGQTEMWSDDAQVPSIVDVSNSVRASQNFSYWDTSL
ncbi:MAG: hypothetical protein ACOH19_09155 [Rhodoglobus sp.]